MLSWKDHPINKHCNNKTIKRYLYFMVRDGYLTEDEKLDLTLVPYRASLSKTMIEKMQAPVYKQLFICEEKSLYPLVLRKIHQYYLRQFYKGEMRNKIFQLVVSEMTNEMRSNAKKYIKPGCYLGQIIRTLHMEDIYKRHPNLCNKIYYCRVV